MNQPTTKATFRMTVRVKRANVEFKQGLGIGVLATQEVTITLPEHYSGHLLAAQVLDASEKMVEDIIDVDIELISALETK